MRCAKDWAINDLAFDSDFAVSVARQFRADFARRLLPQLQLRTDTAAPNAATGPTKTALSGLFVPLQLKCFLKAPSLPISKPPF